MGLFFFFYVLLDGFDLGVGILFFMVFSEEWCSILMISLGNVWDVNEIWLVLMGGFLFGVFFLVYVIILNVFYLLVVIMVVGLIFWVVFFEFWENVNCKLVWNIVFGVGSFFVVLG